MNKSLLVKTLLVAALAIVLMIPVAMIRDLVAERQGRRNEAVSGIAEGWGKRQTVAGPYIAIPYERHWTVVKRETIDGKLRETRNDFKESQVLRRAATRLDWSVDADTSEKARGIYKARLYEAKFSVSGAIALPARASLEDGTSSYKWGTPRLVIGISDPLGIRAAPALTAGGRTYAFSPGAGDAGTPNGLHAPLNGFDFSKNQNLEFAFTLDLAGSEAISIAPLGADTSIAMRADWPHPSFQGRFLPARHEIGADGFIASWKISRFAAQGAGAAASCAFPCSRMGEQVAVSFIEPAGLYQQLERASKYGFLFIGLTFAAFMLLELVRRLPIHAVQYLLVGSALAMFFLLLTALSEHIDFAAAYAAASAACVGLIGLYLIFVLKSATLGLAFSGALTSLYAMLYALLQAEDYSLLGGALVLFGLLAAVMLATRRVDWYALAAAR